MLTLFSESYYKFELYNSNLFKTLQEPVVVWVIKVCYTRWAQKTSYKKGEITPLIYFGVSYFTPVKPLYNGHFIGVRSYDFHLKRAWFENVQLGSHPRFYG